MWTMQTIPVHKDTMLETQEVRLGWITRCVVDYFLAFTFYLLFLGNCPSITCEMVIRSLLYKRFMELKLELNVTERLN